MGFTEKKTMYNGLAYFKNTLNVHHVIFHLLEGLPSRKYHDTEVPSLYRLCSHYVSTVNCQKVSCLYFVVCHWVREWQTHASH